MNAPDGAGAHQFQPGVWLCQLTIHIVEFCARHNKAVLAFATVAAIAAGLYGALHFSITTDVEDLISRDLPWHQRQIELTNAFPQRKLLAVVKGSTPEDAERATAALAEKLSQRSELFRTVVCPDSGAFFDRNGLLFQDLASVEKAGQQLSQLRPLVSALAADPSLRGALQALSFGIQGVDGGQLKLDQMTWPLTLAANTLDDVLAGKRATFSWQTLLQGSAPPASQLRHFIEVDPQLDFSALQPGLKATRAIRQAATDTKLAETFGTSVDLTGEVAINDDQFSVIRTSAVKDTLIAALGVLIVLWFALRSWRIIAAVFFSLVVGLALTVALGLAMVGSFNLLSVAFFVLFVGVGVDFGIQFSVRYRSERHHVDDVTTALVSAAEKAGRPLALAAAATAVGFFSFYPTSYRGLSELGQIAGFGMLIAFATSITLVPAMLAALKPPGEPTPLGFAALAPVDDALQRHRIPIVAVTVLVVLAGIPLLFHTPFDFDPLNLQNESTPSVKITRELQRDPTTGSNDAEVLAGSLDEANATAKRLAALPEVSRTLTLSSLVPADQEQKFAALRPAAQALTPALNPQQKRPQPSDQDNANAMKAASANLSRVARGKAGEGAQAAERLAGLLDRLATSEPATRERAQAAIVPPLVYDLAKLGASLAPQAVSIQTLPPEIVRDWTLPDGRSRVQALPKGDMSDPAALKAFASAVLEAVPTASGTAVTNTESGYAVLTAFMQAGALALLAIAVLLYFVLGRVTDVLLTLAPLVLAGALVLEICVVTGLTLNFANVIALPLLLGIGVAFKIYYVMAWRAGKSGLLQSALTRAVIFSALTNAAAFGSMWASEFPGMSSMGKMMTLSLVCTMAAAVFFQPLLMGPPRKVVPHPNAKKLASTEGARQRDVPTPLTSKG